MTTRKKERPKTPRSSMLGPGDFFGEGCLAGQPLRVATAMALRATTVLVVGAKMSQDVLAEMVGTTRSRVSFFMNKFRELRLIEFNGGLTINTSLLNVVLHD